MAKKKAETTMPPEPAPTPVVEAPPSRGVVRIMAVEGSQQEWWEKATHAASYPDVPAHIAATFRVVRSGMELVVDRSIANEFYLWASMVVGWSDPDRPWELHPISYEEL